MNSSILLMGKIDNMKCNKNDALSKIPTRQDFDAWGSSMPGETVVEVSRVRTRDCLG